MLFPLLTVLAVLVAMVTILIVVAIYLLIGRWLA